MFFQFNFLKECKIISWYSSLVRPTPREEKTVLNERNMTGVTEKKNKKKTNKQSLVRQSNKWSGLVVIHTETELSTHYEIRIDHTYVSFQ